MENLQHVQLPNKMALEGLDPKDQLIYICIRSYMNKDTKEAFPSLQTIATQLSISPPTVSSSIKRLVEKGYITVRKEGRKNVYKFEELEHFEPFSKEFLDNPKISFEVKAFLTASQQFMFKDFKDYGVISMSNKDLSEKIGVSERSVVNYNNELKKNNLMVIAQNVKRDIESGCRTETKIYRLSDLGQAIIWKLKEHEDRLDEHDRRFDELEKKIAEKDKIIEEKNEQIKKLIKAAFENQGNKLNSEKTKYIMQ